MAAWSQRTDELVDGGADATLARSAALDSWEERLEDIFNGCPHDIVDVALADTFQRFPLDIKVSHIQVFFSSPRKQKHSLSFSC